MIIAMTMESVRFTLLWTWITVKFRHFESDNYVRFTLLESEKHIRPAPERLNLAITPDPRLDFATIPDKLKCKIQNVWI
jgi:hypothetical protein